LYPDCQAKSGADTAVGPSPTSRVRASAREASSAVKDPAELAARRVFPVLAEGGEDGGEHVRGRLLGGLELLRRGHGDRDRGCPGGRRRAKGRRRVQR